MHTRYTTSITQTIIMVPYRKWIQTHDSGRTAAAAAAARCWPGRWHWQPLPQESGWVLACGERPVGTWGTSAGAGTKSADSWCGRCDCREASCRTLSSPHGRWCTRCHPTPALLPWHSGICEQTIQTSQKKEKKSQNREVILIHHFNLTAAGTSFPPSLPPPQKKKPTGI